MKKQEKEEIEEEEINTTEKDGKDQEKEGYHTNDLENGYIWSSCY